MSEFKIPPISTLAGSTIRNYFRVLKQGKIEPRYYLTIFLTTLMVIISTPFHIWEWLYFRMKVRRVRFEKPPFFVLGHWRSGTTLLHNLLCKDPRVGYMTTYHSVFPNNLASKWIFKTFMRISMPSERPSDKVKLNINFPQEDEFAFANSQSHAYYNFFYFPREYKKFYANSTHLNDLSEEERKNWFRWYNRMLRKAALNTRKGRLVVKNPINTARVDKLLKLYPDAKFLFLYRNPITVFYSTRRFFQQLFPTLWLHRVDNDFIDQVILDVYQRVMDDYEAQKSMIPAKNLVELRFEQFEAEPLKEMEHIYKQLWEEDFENVRVHFSDYLETQKKHKKNQYEVSKAEMDLLDRKLGKYMRKYGYELPPEVIVK